MCGLWGVQVVQPPNDPVELSVLMGVLADAAATRGRDSWGYAAVSKGSRVWRDRRVGDASATWESVPVVPDGGLAHVLGHTRYATVGDVCEKNAHPWVIHGSWRSMVAAHNGGIWNHRSLGRYRVDSLALLRRIADGGDGSDCEGYGAVHWIDLIDGDPRVCRMAGGDLEAASVRIPGGGRALVWISDMSLIGDLPEYGYTYRPLPRLREGTVYRVVDGRMHDTYRRIRLAGGSWEWGECAVAEACYWCGFDLLDHEDEVCDICTYMALQRREKGGR